MNFLFILASLLEEGPNGEPPGIVFIFLGVFFLFLVGIPIIAAIYQAKQKQRKAEQAAADARRKAMIEERPKLSPTVSQARQDTRTQMGTRLTETLSRSSPELQKRLEEQRKAQELKKTRDTLTGTIKPHKHAIAKGKESDFRGSIDMCDYDDFFQGSVFDRLEEDEVCGVTVDIDFTEEGLKPEYAAEYIIFGDMLNNPPWKKKRKH